MSERKANLDGYISAMAQAKMMLSNGLINQKEFEDLDTMMAKKYGISLDSIFCK